ncbi:hypothetical protein M1D70_16370 [Paenibacillus sp. AK002]
MKSPSGGFFVLVIRAFRAEDKTKMPQREYQLLEEEPMFEARLTQTDANQHFFSPLSTSYHSFADFALSLKMPNIKAFLLFKNVSLPEKKALLHN